MFRSLFLFLVCLFGSTFFVISQESDNQIIVTTPGYTSVYRYSRDDFSERLKRDFRIEGNVTIHQDNFDDGRQRVYVTIGMKQYDFWITPETPYIRLSYDRNKRSFNGLGCNFINRSGRVYTPPSYKGTPLCELQARFEDAINRAIGDRSLLDPDQPTVFILEAEIDENGFVHQVNEINGALRQYARVVIDQFYDKAGRDWEPAKCDGVPFRSLAQIRIELSR